LAIVVSLTRPAAQQSGRAITLPVILAIEDARAPTSADLGVLLEAARRGAHRNAAIRALGRLERRDVITNLLPYLSSDSTRIETANALVQALRGAPLPGVPHGQQEQAILDGLLAAAAAEMARKDPPIPIGLAPIARSIGRMPFERPEQVRAAEALLRRVLETPFPAMEDEPHVGAARGLESLARLSRKVATLDDDTIERLRIVARSLHPKRGEQQRNAMAALVASQSVDAQTLQVALDDNDVEVRRLAVLSLGGSGSVVGDDERLTFVRRSLSDTSFMVRLEGVRAWARRGARDQGCQPLLDALNDQQLHVVLAALDALGDQCRDDPSITDRLTAEARTPPSPGNWQREAHAFLALTKRAPERAAVAMMSFAMHANWQVRLYAARAATVLEDVDVLSRLAADPEDGVAEAVLPALRKRLGSASDAAFIAALNRRNRTIRGEPARPYQVIRTAAIALQGAEATPALIAALRGALERITAEDCETSRDTRLALIARLGELGSPADVSALMPLLEDTDAVIVRAAAPIVQRWSGQAIEVDVHPRPFRLPPTEDELTQQASVVVEMESGKTFEIRFHASQAPLARMRFLELVSRRPAYYDDLTFHRVVPNFVIQGGSPNAHEFCGNCPFMRDEVGLAMNTRGSIGVSTRGRDTGDAQIFINLVDNPRLDHDYTVFGYVCRDARKDGMEVVDSFQEGERMKRLRILRIKAGEACR
jgi:cyclophilin family peptidyl-prolyl cis-trans isomerase/HEAT repeat protein